MCSEQEDSVLGSCLESPQKVVAPPGQATKQQGSGRQLGMVETSYNPATTQDPFCLSIFSFADEENQQTAPKEGEMPENESAKPRHSGLQPMGRPQHALHCQLSCGNQLHLQSNSPPERQLSTG